MSGARHYRELPRGTISVTDRMRAVYRQYTEGSPSAQLASEYGVKRATINAWIKLVHEAQKDERHGGQRRV